MNTTYLLLDLRLRTSPTLYERDVFVGSTTATDISSSLLRRGDDPFMLGGSLLRPRPSCFEEAKMTSLLVVVLRL
ncbi:peptide synthetase [Sesbania bispinosa]|nr:peptide synthetase [Sesbania bispinosa]